ncbi:hypothetical protein GJU39_14115 [Pedobacter petrophilus]|uniref:Uncharacterized protein n=1 Tax=Pedobacter petrophilus TaxID=1908241 RepID=A0A7K0G0J4_9SPHI|nr:hypothetical protein [Pedobacter petrophilus]MRX77221.1 hypothetical protein [Pedobacter petrophilus]
MENQVTNNANALRLFFTEEVFLVEDESVEIVHRVAAEPVLPPSQVEIKPVDNLVSSALNSTFSTPEVVEVLQAHQEIVKVPPVITPPAQEKSFKFLGGNKKFVLILVNDPQHDVSTEQGRELLRKIVKAVDLGTADFALLNYAHHFGVNFAAFHQFFKPVIMLSFGVEISDLQLNYVWQNEIIVHESTRIIFAPNLHQLDSDLTAKKMLWGHLQKIK